MASSISQKSIGKLRVVNKYSLSNILPNTIRIYIGRPAALGNSFSIGRDGNREQVIYKHRSNLPNSLKDPGVKRALIEIINALKKGVNVELVCFCAPLGCHGDNLKELIDLHMEQVGNSSSDGSP